MKQPTNRDQLRRHWLDLLLLAAFFVVLFFGSWWQAKH
jgi:hypothetical protein